MGLAYTIDVERGIVRTRGWGIITSEEIRDDTSRKLADPRFDPRFRSLFDMSDAINLEVSSSTLAGVASTPVYDDDVRRAIVATRDVVYGIARMYASFVTRMGQEVRVFRRRDVAEAWIEEGAA
jgi:hypothetical protein